MISKLFVNEYKYYDEGINNIAGVDEAGRGACAGPLVVSAVILGKNLENTLIDINDSKKLSEKKRENYFEIIKEKAKAYSIIEISAKSIDKTGVHKANLNGFEVALSQLELSPDLAIIDGFNINNSRFNTIGIPKADSTIASVAAASILAKVYRDKIMKEYDLIYPNYGFKMHKGYSTAMHLNNLKEFGPTKIHRFSYKNIANLPPKRVKES